MNLVFLGAPGAGKGTQAGLVSSEFKLAHIATGDLFRQNIEKGSALGLEAKSYMEAGKLVPNELTIKMVLERISAADCATGVIFDGFPRNLEQAEALDRALAKSGRAIDRTVYIKVPEKELLKRLSGRWICRKCQAPYHEISSPPKTAGQCDKCGGELYQRPDDNIETIKERLKVYFAQTAPLIDYYKKSGKLLEVDGTGSAEDISRRITAGVRQKNVNN